MSVDFIESFEQGVKNMKQQKDFYKLFDPDNPTRLIVVVSFMESPPLNTSILISKIQKSQPQVQQVQYRLRGLTSLVRLYWQIRRQCAPRLM